MIVTEEWLLKTLPVLDQLEYYLFINIFFYFSLVSRKVALNKHGPQRTLSNLGL